MGKLFSANNIKLALAGTLLVGSLLSVGAFAAGHASADAFFEDVCKNGGTSDSAACNANGKNTITGPNGILTKTTNVLALVSGIVAVVMIIWGAFTFVTSAGDTSKTQGARKTIIYSVVGLVVIVFARAIILFVLGKV